MDNINQINETYKNRLKKGLNLSLFYRTNTSLNKSLEIVKFSPKLIPQSSANSLLDFVLFLYSLEYHYSLIFFSFFLINK